MARLGGVAFKSGLNKDKHKSAVCEGLNSTGDNKGRLKKGWKWTSSKGCPIPAASTKKAASKKKSASKKKAVPKKTAAKRRTEKAIPFDKRVCQGVNRSGKNKGKLKKGFKWNGKGKCPVPVKKKR